MRTSDDCPASVAGADPDTGPAGQRAGARPARHPDARQRTSLGDRWVRRVVRRSAGRTALVSGQWLDTGAGSGCHSPTTGRNISRRSWMSRLRGMVRRIRRRSSRSRPRRPTCRRRSSACANTGTAIARSARPSSTNPWRTAGRTRSLAWGSASCMKTGGSNRRIRGITGRPASVAARTTDPHGRLLPRGAAGGRRLQVLRRRAGLHPHRRPLRLFS